MQLSDSDIQELIRIRKSGGKKVETLRKKQDKLTAQLAAVKAEIAKLTGEAAPATVAAAEPQPRRRGAPKGGTRRGGRVNFVAKMREVLTNAGTPLRARDIVESLPTVGVKVKDIPYTRKRVSVALATNKCFEQVSRGIYQLKDD